MDRTCRYQGCGYVIAPNPRHEKAQTEGYCCTLHKIMAEAERELTLHRERERAKNDNGRPS